MEENHINDKIGIIKSLSRRDLLLLSAYVDSQNKSFRDIHRRFNKKLKKEFHECIGEEITKHRLRYLLVIKLLRIKEQGRLKGEGAWVIYESKFEDGELSDILRNLGVHIEEKNLDLDNKNEIGKEAVDKLGMLLEKDIIKKSQYRLQMTFPVPERVSCKRIGQTEITWQAGKEFPFKGEDFGYLIWRKRDCCAL